MLTYVNNSMADEVYGRDRPDWSKVFQISLTGDEDIPINKRGSGVRRLILFNFFRAKAEADLADAHRTNIIYGIKEPETSQHPDNQRMLVHALCDLVSEGACQVIVTTHTPVLARLLPESSLRYIEVVDHESRAVHARDEETNKLVAKALGVLPDHDVKVFIGVEGPNDINFLQRISAILHDAGEEVPNLFESEARGQVVFVPVGGRNLALWVSRLSALNRPEFYIFDRDVEPPDTSPHQAQVEEFNARSDCEAVLTSKLEMENYLHGDAIEDARPGIKLTVDDFTDVPLLVTERVHTTSPNSGPWNGLDEGARKQKKSRAKRWLNTQAAEHMTPERLSERNPAEELRGWLRRIRELVSS